MFQPLAERTLRNIFHVFHDEDDQTRRFADLDPWEKANVPFFIEMVKDTQRMFHDFERHCFTRLCDYAKATVALEECDQADEGKVEAYAYNCDTDIWSPNPGRKREKQASRPARSAGYAAESVSPNAGHRGQRGPLRLRHLSVSKADLKYRSGTRKKNDAAEEPVVPVVRAVADTAPQGDQHPDVSSEDHADHVPDERNPKRLKKKAATKDLSFGEFRNDLFFSMERKWVAIKSSLPETIEAIRLKKTTRTRGKSAAAIEELNSICQRLKSLGRRSRPFMIEGKRSEKGADLIMLEIPTGGAIKPDSECPSWNEFPADTNLPRMLLNLSSRILDDAGFVLILHAGSLQSSQQIADTLDAMRGAWTSFMSYDIVNETPSFMEHSRLEQEYWPFDKSNSGRDSLLVLNFNNKMAVDMGGEGLPVYAEQQAQVPQKMLTPVSVRASLKKHDIHGRNLFVDDEARKAREGSSDSQQV
ncbi:hypothetical protein R1sor_014672 [Riccia sorocarpa]|uniref:Uncharacterized protein n=1 Tax=Riccia sorocarpa TaxID=122646 RepID=A0ABD3HAB4_9MARC